LSISSFAKSNSLNTDLTFDSIKNSFILTIDTSKEVNYLLVYKTPSKTEAVKGSSETGSGENFSREIYAGTCSSGGTCVPHDVQRGILKVQVEAEHWLSAKKFIINDGELTIVKKETPTDVQLSDEENSWLEDPSQIDLTTPKIKSPKGNLSARVAKNVDAVTLDLGAQEMESSATLVTDKADYAPTDTVVITGTDFNPGEDYALAVISQDEPPVYFETEVKTNRSGAFIYAYQLDGIYRPNYLVEVKDLTGVILATTTFTDASAWPDCNWNCNANDVNVLSVWLGDIDGNELPTCTPGDPITAYLWATFENNTNTKRYAVRIFDEIYVGGSLEHSLDECIFDTLPPGTDDKMLYNFNWTCGEEVEIRDLRIAWKTSPSTCDSVGEPDCNDYSKSKCYGPASIIVAAPLVADFEATTVCYCHDTKFTDTTTGGIEPYSYSWNFGDGAGTSTDPDPSYHYGESGTYPVTLTVTDNEGRVDSQNHDVIVYENPTANAGPDKELTCTETSVLLDGSASGGTPDYSYEWKDSSSTPMGTTEDITVSVADTYTLTVTDANGCSAQDSATVTQTLADPTLTLVKVLLNDNGGTATKDDFQAYIDGNKVSWEEPQILTAGAHTATESSLAGYTASDWSGEDCAPDGRITLNACETKTCTITNDDIAPKLTVTKTVINEDGGTKVVADFPLFVDSDLVVSGIQNTFSAGAYVVSETEDPGYSATIGGDCDAGGNVTLGLGDVKACTITNDDEQAYIIIDKTVVNDNGGSAAADEFLLTVDGAAVLDGVAYPVNPGEHTAGETGLPGYTAGTWGGDCTSEGLVTVALGESKVCTITNDDIAPSITLIKEVTNNNGGNAGPDDFGISVGGTGVTSGLITNVDANTAYALDEVGLTGYTFVSIGQGTNDSVKCPSVLGGEVTLNEGENITCTITNDDIAPKLTLIKDPTNDDGGNAQPDDFQLTVGGNPVLSGVASTLDANTPYAIDETQVSGYTFVSITGDAKCPSVLGGEVTLDEGDDITCTITNDDQPATLILKKILPNNDGGQAVEGDFAVYINSVQSSWGSHSVDAGDYTVNEDSLAGYTASVWGTDCADDGKVSLLPGETKTCTITNDDIASSISGKKYEDVNGDGDFDINESGLENWTIELKDEQGQKVVSQQTDADGNYSFENVSAGTYSVCEVEQEDYTRTEPAGSNCHSGVVVGLDEQITGIDFGNFENIDVTVCKYVDENGDGDIGDDPHYIEEGGWEVWLGEKSQPTVEGCTTFINVGPGRHTVSESPKDGWNQTYPESGSYDFDAVSGQDQVFDFGNTAQPIEISLIKGNDKPNGASVGDLVTYTLTTTVGEKRLTSMTLIDNLPEGFVYQTGSAVVNGGTVDSAEPILSNAGKTLTWHWSFVPGSSTVSVTYQIIIDSSNQPASYTNFAWVYGHGSGGAESDIVSSVVVIDPTFTLSTVISPQILGVGTERVKILGAATERVKILGAATGSDTWYLITALILIASGILIRRVDPNQTKKE